MPLTLNDSHFLSFNLLKPRCPWVRAPTTTATASSNPSHLPSLHPSFALLLSPGGNYLHKSFFALWFAPFHKWRLSLFNRGGFASHVKAYNVAGPRFLHAALAAPIPFLPMGLSLLGRHGVGGGGAGSKVKAYWAWGSLCTGSGSRLIDLTEKEARKWLKNHLW